MNKIDLLVVNVEGDNAAISDVLKMATTVLNRINGAAEAAPVPGPDYIPPVLAAPARSSRLAAGKYPYQCDRCDASIKDRWAAAAHNRRCPPASKSAARTTSAPERKEFFCPVKNCAKSFAKAVWRDKHLKKDHGVEQSL